MRSISDENDNNNKINSRKRNHRITIMVIFLVILLFTIYFFYNKNNKKYNTYEVETTTERTDSNTVQYMKYGNKLFKYSRDGASVIDGKGKVVWNSTYDMKEPKADICGDYVAVGDIGNKKLVVFDVQGNAEEVDTILPILQVRVAKQGVAAVLLQDKDSNKISLYYPFDTAKPLIMDLRTTTDDGYPIDIDISEDGTKLVTSYLSTNNGVTENTVTFYSFSEVGQNAINNIMGVYVYKQVVVPKVEFLTNDIVCAFAENKFSIYSMKEQPKVIHEEAFESEIRSIFSDNEHIGFILENLEGSEKYIVKVYNLSGKKILDKTIDYDYENVRIYGNDIIFYSDLESYILRLNGKEKFHGTFDKNISYMMPINSLNKYFLIDDVNIEEIKLVEDK